MVAKLHTRKDLMGLGKRMSGYFFWYLIGFFVRMGLPHLLFFPLCMYLMGKEDFGKFIYAFGIISMIGLAPTKGLGDTFLRNIANIAENRRDLFLSTIMILAAIAIGGLLLLSGAVLLFMAGFNEDRQLLAWLLLVAVAFAAQNMVAIKITSFSFKRQFAQRALWQSIEGIAGFAAIPLIVIIGAWGLPIGYAAGHMAAYLLLIVVYNQPFRKAGESFDRNMAKRITASWIVLTSSGIFLLSSRYIHRSVLGIWSDYESVSVFFSATAVLETFIMPVDILGLFGYSILSAHSSKKIFSKQFSVLYTAVAGITTGITYLMICLFAQYILQIMYPSVTSAARQLIPIMGIGISMMVLAHLMRPFVMKFATAKTMLIISVVSLIAHAGAAFILIPKWNITGAAYSYCVGCGVVGLSWLAFFMDRFLFRPKRYTFAGSIDNIDAEAIEEDSAE